MTWHCPTRVLPVLALMAAVLVAGCSTPAPPAPVLPEVPAAFRHADPPWVDARAAESQPRGNWWMVFADPVLTDLVEAASSSNTSIQSAAARLAKARAVARAADANRMPQITLNAGVDRQGGPLINAAGSSGMLYTLSAGASYEADLVGKLAREVDAATLDAESREALLQSTRLLVHADIAQGYFALRLLDVERAVVRDTWRAHQETLRLTERRFQLGSVAELDVVRLRADAASAEAELLALDRRRAELEHALALLAGKVASTFRIEEREWASALPIIPAGIPSTLLTRRPDIASAQRSMLAAQSRVGVAQTAWFPSVSLTTVQGFASVELRDLLAVSARAYGLGAVLALPLFDGGRREAAVHGARADLETAVAGYREQILVAFREVEDHLSGLRLLADQQRAQGEAVAAAGRARLLARSRYDSGLASQLELLDAQRNELRNRRQALQVSALQYQATVGLIRALGGGWESPQAHGAAGDGTHRRAGSDLRALPAARP